MERTVTLPPPVIDLLSSAFPGAPVTGLAPTVGGFSNLSALATIGGARCVVKAARLPARRADLRREALVLARLHGERVGAPIALAFVEGEGWSALVTRRRPGRPGITLYGGPPAELAPVYSALGRALARLHALPPGATEPPPELDMAGRADELIVTLGDLPIPAEVRAPLVAALAHPVWRAERPRLVHGDAGLHNVLWGRRGLTLLDWELAGLGDPRLDLAWVAWTMRFRGLPPALWDDLLAGYGRERALALGLEDEALRALTLGQIAVLLARAASSPAWAEWLRRARAAMRDKRC